MNNLAIYFFDYSVACYGNIIDMFPHSHHYLQICIGIKEGFTLFFDDVTVHSKAILINNDISHQFRGNDDNQLILLLDPESLVGIKMKQMITTSYIHLDCNSEIFSCLKSRTSPPIHDEMNQILENFLAGLTGLLIKHPDIDPRVKEVKKLINDRKEDLSIRELADSVYLSESRLLHLFKEEIGIPIKQYALWRKLISAVQYILDSGSFTDAAFAGGFSDSAHLSRTFKRMFGVTLTEVFKNSNSVQVFLANKKYI